MTKIIVFCMLLFYCSLCLGAKMPMESLSDACFQTGNSCPDSVCIENELTYNGADADLVESSACLATWNTRYIFTLLCIAQIFIV